jgi:outer membrane protein
MTVVCAVTVMTAGGALAQTPPTQPPASQKPPAPTPAPQTPAQPPVTPPAMPPPATQAPPRPFPEGAKIAYIDIQAVASNSVDGKAATARIQELTKKKSAEITEKNKALESAKTKQQTQLSVMNDSARLQLEKEIDKLQREVQFMQQEAQSEGQALQAELQVDFQRKLNPILDAVAKEKGLHLLINIADSGAVWVDTGLDLTQEVIKRLDASSKSAPAKK